MLKPCPNCGCEEYLYKLVVVYSQAIDLNEKEIDAEPMDGSGEPKLFECSNCHKKFRRKTIEGADASLSLRKEVQDDC